MLVLDTEVYSNTGGQASKATPRGAVAKFAAAGKRTAKKDLGLIAIGYGDVYVAQIALGARRRPDREGASRRPSHIQARRSSSPTATASRTASRWRRMAHQKEAVDSGYWPLYRYDPRIEKPLRLDSKRKRKVSDFLAEENRFASLQRTRPETAEELDALEQGASTGPGPGSS